MRTRQHLPRQHPRRRLRRTRPVLALLLLATFLLTAAPPGTAAAHPTPNAAQPAQRGQQPASDEFEVGLASVSPSAGPDRPLRVHLAATLPDDTPPDGADLEVRLFAGTPVTTRSQFHDQLNNSPPAYDTLLGTQTVPAVRAAAGTEVTLPPLDFPLPQSLGASHSGVVLPILAVVQADLGGETESARLSTYAVYVSERVANPLALSMIVPLTEPTHRLPDGTFVDDRLAGRVLHTGSLGRIAAELARPDAPPVNLMVDPLIVEQVIAMASNDWRLRVNDQTSVQVTGTDRRSRGAAEFRENLSRATSRAGVQLLSFPYANPDLVALVRNNLDGDAHALITKGREDLADMLGTAPDGSILWPPGGMVEAATLATLGRAGVRTVILSPEMLPVRSDLTQNATVQLEAGTGQPAQALVGDPALSSALADPSGTERPAQLAQRFLAETAIAWLERPGGSDPAPRGVLVTPPTDWRPHPPFFSALMRGLQSAPWLNVVPVEQLAATVPPGPDETPRQLQRYGQDLVAEELPASYLQRIADAQRELKSFRSTVPLGYAPADDYARYLMVAESSAYRDSPARVRGQKFIRAAEQGIASHYDGIEIKETATVLTARTGGIVITMANHTDQPLTVRLKLTSEKVDIDSAERFSEPFVLAPQSAATQERQVRTRTTGTFPITVEVLTADGKVQVAEAVVAVRSTALNRVTLLLMGGAGGFLVLWWTGKQVRARRRKQEDQAA